MSQVCTGLHGYGLTSTARLTWIYTNILKNLLELMGNVSFMNTERLRT